jgi:hypothetical protein
VNPIIEDILELGSIDEVTGTKVLELLIVMREELYGKELIHDKLSIIMM